MAYPFPSEQWVLAYKDAVNANEAYREAGKPWTFGPVAMMIRADASAGIDEDTGMILDVHEGECREAEYIKGTEQAQRAAFIIIAGYESWKQVINQELDPIQGMMDGKLELAKGELPTMIRFVEASRQLVHSATRVPTEFVA